jgi:hypothetical protein
MANLTIQSTPSISNVWYDIVESSFNNTAHKRLLVKMRYIELGLIPPSPSDTTIDFDSDVRAIDAALASMSPEDRRKTARKFRKMVRKVAKRGKEKSRSARRSAVYSAIWRIVSNEIDPKVDLDDGWVWAAQI